MTYCPNKPKEAALWHHEIAELPFDSDYKFMATFHKMKADDGTPIVRGYVKGAPDVILGRASTGRVSAFNRDIFHDRNQVLLYGFALLLTFLPTELGFMQRILGTTSLSGNLWLLCIVLAFILLLVDEVIKVFLRSRRGHAAAAPVAAAPVAAAPAKA